MLCVIPVCTKDLEIAKLLLGWIGQLGGMQSHTALLIKSASLPDAAFSDLFTRAQGAGFAKVFTERQSSTQWDRLGWPWGPNDMFGLAVEWVQRNAQRPFLWLEPDAIPLKAGWLACLETEYNRHAKPYMGTLGPVEGGGRHLTGVAVYPAAPMRYNKRSAQANRFYPRLPFDIVDARYTLAHAALTPLIQHVWSDNPPENKPWTFPNADSLKRISPDAVLFHRCKDGSLIRQLQAQIVSKQVPVKKSKHWHGYKIGLKVRALLRLGSTYYHSGNIGDIIYALYAINKHGGGDLLIGPEQNDTSPCGVPINEAQFAAFEPLLKLQPYLRRIEFRPKYAAKELHYDLNTFRDNWDNTAVRNRTRINNLCEMHFHTLGIWHLFDPMEAWLDVDKPIRTGRIIIHRSKRYRCAVYPFPWSDIVRRHGNNLLFVGMEDEHADFQRLFGKVSFWRVTDLLEMARLIAGSIAFIGNQSSPCAMALGMGQRVYQEAWFEKSADCIFKRTDWYLNQKNKLEEFEEWL